jgi:hypothetical protein
VLVSVLVLVLVLVSVSVSVSVSVLVFSSPLALVTTNPGIFTVLDPISSIEQEFAVERNVTVSRLAVPVVLAAVTATVADITLVASPVAFEEYLLVTH